MKLTLKNKNWELVLDNLSMNGTNYVSDSKVDTSNWPEMFSLVAVDDEGNTTEQIDNAKLIQQETYTWDAGKWYLAFASYSQQEIFEKRQNAKMEYLAMMTDVDLDA